jgi:muramoyltetrapeptide carboxypeptidase
MNKTPGELHQGDVVSLVATARKVNEPEMEFAKQLLTSWGLIVKEGKHLYSDTGGYFSATDALRLQDLQQALNDTEIKAILCARGGYGTTRILDSLNFSKFHQHPKWIIGFSDITSLHIAVCNEHVMSIHGNMPISMHHQKAEQANVALQNLLFSGRPNPILWNTQTKGKQGSAEGVLAGGNLSLLVDSIGTKTEVNTNNCVLILEEIDEYHYKIDRMLNQLKRAGKLDKLAALLIGYFTDCKQGSFPFHNSIEEIIKDYTKEYNYPVGFNFPSGHEQPNMPWIHGAKVKVDVAMGLSTLQYV